MWEYKILVKEEMTDDELNFWAMDGWKVATQSDDGVILVRIRLIGRTKNFVWKTWKKIRGFFDE